MEKRGQITIFVIVGIIFIIAITIIFFINPNRIISNDQDSDNPESFLDNCIREQSYSLVNEMLLGAGFTDSNDTIMHQGNEITYLCKNINNFEPCINQYPVYLTQIEREFESKIKNDVEQCFASLRQEFSRKNYQVEFETLTVDARIKPRIVELSVYSDVSIVQDDFSRTFSQFDTSVQSSLYDLGFIANEIISQEAMWCHFSNDGFMALYKDYDIRVNLLDDTTKIYTITDKRSQEKLTMATRGCAMPAGLF